jgi:hypothetical protein
MVGRAQAMGAAAAVAATGAGIALSGAGDPPPSERPPAAQAAQPAPPAATARLAVRRLTCANSLGAARGPGPGRADVLSPPVRLMSLDRFARHPRRHFRATRERDFFAKSPLIVDAGATVRLEIPRRDRAHVSFAYGLGGGTSAASRVEDGAGALLVAGTCQGGRPTGWPGSVVVDGARCVRLTVRATTRVAAPPATVRIPFGRGTCANR